MISLALALALSVSSLGESSPAATPKLVYRFPPAVRLENIASLPNSTLVVCDALSATLYALNPLVPKPSPYFVHHFTNSTGIWGIASLESTSLLVTGNDFFPANYTVAPGSNKIYRINLDREGHVGSVQTFPVPKAGWLNGITVVPEAPHYVLAADCFLGAIVRIDTRTGDVTTVSTDLLLGQTSSADSLPIGVNGVHVRNNFVYFTNSFQRLYGRLAITKDGLSAGKPAEIVAYPPDGATFDDFAIQGDGTAFVMTLGAVNGIDAIRANGNSTMVAQWPFESTNISQVTSAVVDTSAANRRVLYFATAGQYYGSNETISGGEVFSLALGC